MLTPFPSVIGITLVSARFGAVRVMQGRIYNGVFDRLELVILHDDIDGLIGTRLRENIFHESMGLQLHCDDWRIGIDHLPGKALMGCHCEAYRKPFCRDR